MTPATPSRARLEELLGIEATQKLTRAEEAELDALLVAFSDQDPDAFERAAAAVHLALLGPTEEMPNALAEQLHLTAVALTPTPAPVRPASQHRERRAPLAMWAGWAVAAGLAGVLVYQLSKPKEVVRVDPPPPPTLAEVREDIKTKHEYRPATFAAAKGNLSGTVVWSDVKQDGVLEVKGLPPNDPTKEQYQLWIVDAKRPKDFPPISAGVFDVKAGGPTLLRVNASIPVGDAGAFVISKEGPGGVWQTTPDKMLLVMPAKVG